MRNRPVVGTWVSCDYHGVCLMSCPSCASQNEAEFATEMMIHFRGLLNLDYPGVLAFPQVSICLDCGASRFTTTRAELRVLREGTTRSLSAAA